MIIELHGKRVSVNHYYWLTFVSFFALIRVSITAVLPWSMKLNLEE